MKNRARMKSYGHVLSSVSLPAVGDAIATDIETGSHHMNNYVSETFSERFPSLVAVAEETDARMPLYRDAVLALYDIVGAARAGRFTGDDLAPAIAALVAIDERLPPVECPRCGGSGEEPGVPEDPDLGVALCSACKGQCEVSGLRAEYEEEMA
jgi:hypothetical protein